MCVRVVGKRDGQTLMVKEENNSITAHQWSASEGRWVKVGDVVGSKGGEQNAGGKTNFMGKVSTYESFCFNCQF